MPHPVIKPADPDARRPNSSRLSSPPTSPLHTISETPPIFPAAPPIPVRSAYRRSTSSISIPRSVTVEHSQISYDKSTSAGTSRTGPPAYDWIAEPRVVDAESLDHGPIEGEKLAALRRAGGYRRPQRGGCWRVLIIAAALCLVIVALAIGLGVGLTIGRRHKGNASGASNTTNGDTSSVPSTPFPLGQYSVATVLQDVITNCTSDPSTWTCYPAANGANASPGDTAGFNWALTNTSSTYATYATPPTSEEGIPANLSITSTSAILGFPFSDQPLTYISSSQNSSAARYTFTFTTAKAVFPSAAITADNAAAECFFNQTVFTGTLYLVGERNDSSTDSGGSGQYMQWPYAVEVSQTSVGGADTPACYEYVNGAVGARITTGLTPQSANSQCSCDYRNF